MCNRASTGRVKRPDHLSEDKAANTTAFLVLRD
jgi:hypothetical protein